MSSRPYTPLPDYPDNLAEARAEGRTGGFDHRPPVATREVRDIARELVEDEDYQDKLQTRLREGTAGAMEIWLWRWAYGDPKRAGDANADETQRKFKALRADVLTIIRTRPDEAAALEDRLLEGLKPKTIPAEVSAPVQVAQRRPKADALLERLEADHAEEDE